MVFEDKRHGPVTRTKESDFEAVSRKRGRRTAMTEPSSAIAPTRNTQNLHFKGFVGGVPLNTETTTVNLWVGTER